MFDTWLLPLIDAVAAAPVPPPPEKETVGADEYPDPGVSEIILTRPVDASTAVPAAPAPPPTAQDTVAMPAAVAYCPVVAIATEATVVPVARFAVAAAPVPPPPLKEIVGALE